MAHEAHPQCARDSSPLPGPGTRVRWLAGLAAALWVSTGLPATPEARADASELPERLVVQFEASAGRLDQEQIRLALTRELGVPLAAGGSAGAPTLSIGVGEGGDLVLTYDPERRRVSRHAPVTASSDVPELVAQLAGNMVRDEAAPLLAELSPPAPAAVPAVLPDAAPTTPAAKPTAQGPGADASPARDAAWSLTVLLGGGIEPMAFGVLSVQAGRRFGRVELGLAIDAAAGRGSATVNAEGGHAGFYGGSGDYYRESLSVLSFTLPLSVDVDLLRRQYGYLQVGGVAGYRILGAFHTLGHVSGSDGDLFLGARFSAGLALGEGRSLVLRGNLDIWPQDITISAGEDTLDVLPFGSSVQLGYAMVF